MTAGTELLTLQQMQQVDGTCGISVNVLIERAYRAADRGFDNHVSDVLSAATYRRPDLPQSNWLCGGGSRIVNWGNLFGRNLSLIGVDRSWGCGGWHCCVNMEWIEKNIGHMLQ
jgi:hypothetical protein